jgi:hypothetical protein
MDCFLEHTQDPCPGSPVNPQQKFTLYTHELIRRYGLVPEDTMYDHYTNIPEDISILGMLEYVEAKYDLKRIDRDGW